MDTRPTRNSLTTAGLSAVFLMLSAGTAHAARVTHSDDECCQSLKDLYWQEDSAFAGFDAATGKDLRNFPPTRDADHKHLKIEIAIPTMDAPHIEGKATLTFAPIAKPLSTLTLDARAMKVRSVSIANHNVSFGHDGMVLSVAIEPPIPTDESADIVIQYDLNDPPEGLLWTGANSAMPQRTPQIHTQGQAEANSYWFPCRDFPNERLTTELIATVPEGFMVSSNGRLVSHNTTAKSEVWHWMQDKSHVPYLVSMVVGRFDVVDVGSDALSMPVYVPPGRGKDIEATYGRTPEMVTAFEKLLDEKYPWDRYAQLVVTNFNSGGMENTSATSMHDWAIIDQENQDDYDIEGLIAHELAHQWFGDLITCNSWEHLWLNEGFATYFAGIWFEERKPAKGEASWTGGPLAYERNVIGWFDQIIANDRGTAPSATGMASKVYAHPGEAFGRPANPYPKGASTLHMLRRKLGDDLFWAGLRLYVERRKFTTVETVDLRRTFEEVSGQSLEQFFYQWCTRPGIPRIKIEQGWDSDSTTLTISASQTQTINGDNPAFECDLPVIAHFADGTTSQGILTFQGRDATLNLQAAQAPLYVEFDPSATLLAELTISQDSAALIAQAQHAKTLYSRTQAVRTLARVEWVDARSRLAKVVMNSADPVSLRVEAFRAWAKGRGIRDVLHLLEVPPWELREAVAQQLGELARGTDASSLSNTDMKEAASALLFLTSTDSSQKVRCAALRALGQVRDPRAIPAISKALATDSHSDAIRQAAIDAATTIDSKDLLKKLIPICAPSNNARTRASAVAAVATLARHDPDAALDTMTMYLGDRIARVQRAAGDGMTRLKDPRGLDILAREVERERSQAMKRQLERWHEALEKSLEAEATKAANKAAAVNTVTTARSPKK